MLDTHSRRQIAEQFRSAADEIDKQAALQERPPDPATILHRLRTAFAHWAFLHDPRTGIWTALRGTAASGVTIEKRDPLALRIAVAEAEGRPR